MAQKISFLKLSKQRTKLGQLYDRRISTRSTSSGFVPMRSRRCDQLMYLRAHPNKPAARR